MTRKGNVDKSEEEDKREESGEVSGSAGQGQRKRIMNGCAAQDCTFLIDCQSLRELRIVSV